MKIEWDARWSGGMKECVVLIRDGEIIPQGNFARRVRHIQGGSELYRAEVEESDTALFLYLSGREKTRTARELTGEIRQWESWDEAEAALDLPEGSLAYAFWNVWGD